MRFGAGISALLVITLAIVLFAAGDTPTVRFVDIAVESGLTVPNTFGGKEKKDFILESTGNGAAIFDYNGDGANDIFIANGTVLTPNGPPTHSQLYRNDGKGHFTDVARQAGLTRTGWAQAACVGDFDNDGNPDLFVTYYGPNSLYRNRGDGRFTEVTAAAGLPTEGTRWGSGCAFIDYDNDGYLDIFVANYVELDLANTPKPGSGKQCEWKGMAVACGPRGLPMAHNALYHNNRNGTFTDVSEKAGILAPGGRYGLGVVVADFDNDGWPDIYVACDQTASLLYHNNHDGTFEERGAAAGVAYNADGHLQAGMGIAVADYDGNGFLDIAKTNFSGDRPSLFRNEDGKFFEDVSERAGLGKNLLLGWGMAFLDVDEDGWPDLVIANGHVYPEIDHSPVGETYRQKTLLYRNRGNGLFTDVTATAGPGFAVARPARGLATGDFDGDGRPEILIVNMNERPALLKNTGSRQNAIAIALTGTRSNRSAIGARCTVNAGGRRQIADVVGGGSYYSQNSSTLYFGVGQAQKIDSIEVRWPAGEKQVWSDIAPNSTIRLTEGEEKYTKKAFSAATQRSE
jgi:enediyne biosynthesis protein E4